MLVVGAHDLIAVYSQAILLRGSRHFYAERGRLEHWRKYADATVILGNSYAGGRNTGSAASRVDILVERPLGKVCLQRHP